MVWNWFSGVRGAALRAVTGSAAFAALLAVLVPALARAEEGTLVGQPTPWHIGLQPSVSPVSDQMHNRSEERRVGKACVSRFRSRWLPYNYKNYLKHTKPHKHLSFVP